MDSEKYAGNATLVVGAFLTNVFTLLLLVVTLPLDIILGLFTPDGEGLWDYKN
jgi:hypothetical protein